MKPTLTATRVPAILTVLALLAWALWSGFDSKPDAAPAKPADAVQPALADTVAGSAPVEENFTGPTPPPAPPSLDPELAPAQPAQPAQPAVAAQSPALGLPPAPYQPAGKGKVFAPPRLVQPATLMGPVGVRTPEVEREIREDAAKITAEKAAAIAWAKANGWPIKGRARRTGVISS